jgi:hypothetical protein
MNSTGLEWISMESFCDNDDELWFVVINDRDFLELYNTTIRLTLSSGSYVCMSQFNVTYLHFRTTVNSLLIT